jgi:hypothetical protein
MPSLSSTGVRDAFDVSVVCVAASLIPENTSDVRWAASLGTANDRVSSFLMKIVPGGSEHDFERRYNRRGFLGDVPTCFVCCFFVS